MPSRDELIREWVAMFGDLPEEWIKDIPSIGATGMDFSTFLILLWSYQH